MAWGEDGLNLIEWTLGLDLDGDGDVGLAGTPAHSMSAWFCTLFEGWSPIPGAALGQPDTLVVRWAGGLVAVLVAVVGIPRWSSYLALQRRRLLQHLSFSEDEPQIVTIDSSSEAVYARTPFATTTMRTACKRKQDDVAAAQNRLRGIVHRLCALALEAPAQAPHDERSAPLPLVAADTSAPDVVSTLETLIEPLESAAEHIQLGCLSRITDRLARAADVPLPPFRPLSATTGQQTSIAGLNSDTAQVQVLEELVKRIEMAAWRMLGDQFTPAWDEHLAMQPMGSDDGTWATSTSIVANVKASPSQSSEDSRTPRSFKRHRDTLLAMEMAHEMMKHDLGSSGVPIAEHEFHKTDSWSEAIETARQLLDDNSSNARV